MLTKLLSFFISFLFFVFLFVKYHSANRTCRNDQDTYKWKDWCIITCFYNDEYTDDELYDLGDQARKLFDDELLENNPRNEYFKNLKEDISEYHDKSKTIASSAVDSSNDVEYKEVDGDDCAYVKASYFIKEGNAYSRTYQMYVLRKDADGNWKILVFYQVNGDSSDDE